MLTSDRILASFLIVFSALWCWWVVRSIPFIDDGSGLGSRGFPLGLGMLLGVLGLLLMLGSVRPGPVDEGDEYEPPRGTEIWAVTVTVLLLAGYAVLLFKTGFLIATAVIVAVALGPVLGVWRPVLMAGMSLGISLGVYLILHKLLGVYLPYGSWTNLAF